MTLRKPTKLKLHNGWGHNIMQYKRRMHDVNNSLGAKQLGVVDLTQLRPSMLLDSGRTASETEIL